MSRADYENLVRNAMAWAKCRPDPVAAIEWLAGSGMVVPAEQAPLWEAAKRLGRITP